MITLAILVVALAAPGAPADTIYLKGGGKLNGVILKEDELQVIIRVKITTCTVKRSEIDSIVRTPVQMQSEADTSRISSWERCVEAAIRKPYFSEIQAIPATVIDKGVLKYVPYMSFKSGNYELNIYGDPATPACIEIGVTGDLLRSEQAKKNCIAFMRSVLTQKQDQEVIGSLKLLKDSKVVYGMTFEITPETAEDAYGGWWVSVYDEKALDKSRASDKELAAITVRKSEIRSAGTGKSKDSGKAENVARDEGEDWKSDDLRYARTVPGESGGGLVYVRGYSRKDGTYVRPHTRSSPRR
jgi:hypothetical protein